MSIFRDADGAFLRHLALAMKPCLFLPGEFIVHRGDVGCGMFFLYRGEVIEREGGREREEREREGERRER